MNQIVRKPLAGEIIAPGKGVHLVLALHPLKIAAERREAPAGLSIAELVALAEARQGGGVRPARVLASVNGEVVPEAMWRAVRPKPGTTVLLRGLAGDGDTLRSVLGLAIVALGFVLSPIIAPILGVSASLVNAAITIGGALLVNALFPVRPAQLDSRQASATYSLTGAQNQLDPFGVVPAVLGRHRVYPKFAAQPYTEFVGDDQYLRMLAVVGYGPLAISDIKIGETPIGDFEDVEVEVREGYDSDVPVTLYPATVTTVDLSIDLKQSTGYQSRVSAPATDELQVDFVFPSGVFDGSGSDRTNYTVELQAQYRAVGSTPWLSLGLLSITSRAPDAIRRTLRKVVARGQYEVRVAKTSADAGEDATGIAETVLWTALRSINNDPPIAFDKPLALIALRIRATSQLNGVIDTLNVIADSRVKAFNGAAWTNDAASRNPADLFRHVLQGPANARPAADQRIDFDMLQLWWAYCRDNGFTFDHVRDFSASVYDTLADVASAGRAAVVFRDGKWSVVWDDPDAPITGHYTPRNSWGFASKRSYRHLPHAWRVRFVNEEKGYQQDERIVYDDGYSAANATRFEGIEFPGQVNPANVWRHGRFHIAQARLQPETYTLSVDIEHMVQTRGDRVRVTHDVPMWGLASGRVKGVSGQTVTLDEPVTMEGDKAYAIRFRLADDATLVRTVTTDDGEQSSLTLAGTADMPAAGDLFMFGEAGSETTVLRIKSIKPGDEQTAVLTLVDDAPAISTADQGDIPAFDSHISVPPDLRSAAPVNLAIDERLASSGGTVVSVAQLTWETLAGAFPASFDAEVRDDTGDGQWRAAGSVAAPTKYIFIEGLAAGVWSFRVRANFAGGQASRFAALTGVQLRGLSIVPQDVGDFRIDVIDDTATLSWAPAALADHYVVRFSPALSGATWGSATVILPHVDATSAQVPTLVGTYLIKAVSLAGIESDQATTVITNVAGLRELNVVETFQAEPAWSGERDAVEVEDDALRLIAVGGVLDWPPVLEIEPPYWLSNFPYEYGALRSDQVIDLGEVFTCRVSAIIDAAGDNIQNVVGAWGPIGGVGALGGANADAWQVRLYERHTLDDPDDPEAVWSALAEITLRDITARAFGKFEVRLYSLAAGVTPVVFSAKVTIDMPDRVIAGNDILSSAGATTRIDFDPPFRHFEGVGIAPQDLPTGARWTITDKDETGFDIRFYDSGGAGIAKTFDYVAKGYGKQAA